MLEKVILADAKLIFTSSDAVFKRLLVRRDGWLRGHGDGG